MKLERQGIEPVPAEQRTVGTWDMLLIWFGASVALPRIFTGGAIASGLGFRETLLVCIVGAIIAYAPLAILGHMGFHTRLTGMASTRLCFGVKGSYVPAGANGIALLGWGANVTVITGLSINIILKEMIGYENLLLWIVVMGIIQTITTAYGVRSVAWLQRITIPLLAVLTAYTGVVILNNYGLDFFRGYTPATPITIMLGIDLVAASSFAWGAAVGDYARFAKNSYSATWGTLAGSFVGAAAFMLVGGLSLMALGDPNPMRMMLEAGLGIPALLIIVLSSLTTNVLNLYSSSISFVNIFPKVEPWKIIFGGGAAMVLIASIPGLIGYFVSFLLLMASIFVPLIGIMLSDYYLVKKRNIHFESLLEESPKSQYWYTNGFNIKALVVWAIGVAVFWTLSSIAPQFGSTIPTFLITIGVYYVMEKIAQRSPSMQDDFVKETN